MLALQDDDAINSLVPTAQKADAVLQPALKGAKRVLLRAPKLKPETQACRPAMNAYAAEI
jgi:hypothetical protein